MAALLAPAGWELAVPAAEWVDVHKLRSRAWEFVKLACTECGFTNEVSSSGILSKLKDRQPCVCRLDLLTHATSLTAHASSYLAVVAMLRRAQLTLTCPASADEWTTQATQHLERSSSLVTIMLTYTDASGTTHRQQLDDLRRRLKQHEPPPLSPEPIQQAEVDDELIEEPESEEPPSSPEWDLDAPR